MCGGENLRIYAARRGLGEAVEDGDPIMFQFLNKWIDLTTIATTLSSCPGVPPIADSKFEQCWVNVFLLTTIKF